MELYALNLAEDCRVLSATYDRFAPADWPRVAVLPDGDITDYKYMNERFFYEPLPKEPEPEPAKTIDEIVAEKVKEELKKLKI